MIDKDNNWEICIYLISIFIYSMIKSIICYFYLHTYMDQIWEYFCMLNII